MKKIIVLVLVSLLSLAASPAGTLLANTSAISISDGGSSGVGDGNG